MMKHKDNRRTLLYIHSSNEMYGADVILLQLVSRLDPTKFRIIVVVPTDLSYDGRLSKALTEHNIRVIGMNLAVLRRSYFSLVRFPLYLWRFLLSLYLLIRLIQHEQVDLVHSNTLAVIPGAIAAKVMGIKHVWHVHEIIVKPRFLWKLTSWLAAHLADNVVSVSQATHEHLCAGNSQNAQHGIVIYNGIDTTKFQNEAQQRQVIRTEWGILPNQSLVGMVGRFSHWKGQSYLLDVAKQVSQTFPNVRFAFVGGTIPGQNEIMEDFKRKIERLDLKDIVIYSDYRTDIPAVIDAYDIFVLPSIQPDPFPTVVLEAMAMARPVVANAIGGCLEMIEDHQTGLLAKPGAIDEMANSILYLLNHPLQATSMGQAALERIDRLFSLEAFVSNWTSLYERLTNQGETPSDL